MRKIDTAEIGLLTKRLLIEANYVLSDDIKGAIDTAAVTETVPQSREILEVLRQNYIKAEEMVYPLCQDTGMAIVFIKIGQDVCLKGEYLLDVVNKGIASAYKEGYLRSSVVGHPLTRKNTGDNTPGVIYTEIAPGDKVEINVMPKGFGAENQSGLKMFTPSSDKKDIVDFIVNGINLSGGKGCPPGVLGVGIGGSFDYAALMAKKALLIPLNETNPDPILDDMEKMIMERTAALGVGPMGLGGRTTLLGVRMLAYPTHIAGLPVAYNYCCHSCRHKKGVL